MSGGGEALPTETPHFSKRELTEGAQIGLSGEGEAGYGDQLFLKRYSELKNGRLPLLGIINVASFIKEFVVEIPEDMNYKAGGYIQIEIPPL